MASNYSQVQRITIEKCGDGLRITILSRRRRWTRLGLIWQAFGLVVMVAGLAVALKWNRLPDFGPPTLSLVFIIVAFFAVIWLRLAARIVYLLLWQFTGRELIDVTNQAMTVTRQVAGRDRAKSHKVDDIRELRAIAANPTLLHLLVGYARLGDLPKGTFEIRTPSNRQRFGIEIDEAEAGSILNAIQTRFPAYVILPNAGTAPEGVLFPQALRKNRALLFFLPVLLGPTLCCVSFMCLGAIGVAYNTANPRPPAVVVTGTVTYRTIYTGTESPQYILADQKYVFWTSDGSITRGGGGRSSNDMRLMRMNKDGSGLTPLVTETLPAWNLAMDADSLYWVGPAGVGAISKESGVVRRLQDWPIPSDWTQDYSLAVDDKFVYWAKDYENAIQRIDKQRGGEQVVIAVDGRISSLVVGEESIFWTDGSLLHGKVFQTSKDGTRTVELASEQDWPLRLRNDDRHLYWTVMTDPDYHGKDHRGALLSISLDGSNLIKLVSDSIPDLAVVDEGFVYWISSTRLSRIPRNGGDIVTLANVNRIVNDMTLDDTHVYLTEGDENAIYAISKN